MNPCSTEEQRLAVYKDPDALEEVLSVAGQRGEVSLCERFCGRFGSGDARCEITKCGRIPPKFCEAYEVANLPVDDLDKRALSFLQQGDIAA